MNVNSSQIIEPIESYNRIQQHQIANYIKKIRPAPLNQQKFDQLLQQWIQYSQERANIKQKMMKIVQTNKKDQKNAKINSTCLVCFQQITKKKQWCRVCGMECCIKCIARYRVFTTNLVQQLKDQKQAIPVPCCEKCDKLYIEALAFLEDQRQFEIRARAFQRIQKMSVQQMKLSSKKQQVRYMTKKLRTLKSLNKSIKLQTLQLQKKITWGEQVKNKLQKQYKKIRKRFSKSFSFSVAQQNFSQTIDPPIPYQSEGQKSEQSMLNSVTNSVIQDQTQLIVDKGKCCTACKIF